MNVQVNGKSMQVAAPCTVQQLLEQLDIETRFVAVEVNLDIVPLQRHADHQLHEGDELEVVTLVGGG